MDSIASFCFHAATIGGFSIASWRSIKALLQQERNAAQKADKAPDESAHAWSPDVMLQFWVTSGLLHYLATLHLPYAAELRTLLLLVCIAPGLGITASTSIYQHATKPLVDAVAPTVVPRVLRLKRSSQKAAVAALQPMLTMATESLLPYAAPEDLDRAQEAMERLRAQVTKRRRELEIRGLARPLMGSPTASVLGQAAANVMESVQGAVQADDQAPPPSSDRSSMEAAAQGAWSMVSGLVRMLPAAQGATSPRHSSAAGTVTSAASGGSGASGVVSGDAQGTWEAGLEDMDAVLDDDQVPLAFVDEDSSPPPARGRHTMAGPGAAKGQRQPRTRASDGYTMRKRSGGTRGAMH